MKGKIFWNSSIHFKVRLGSLWINSNQKISSKNFCLWNFLAQKLAKNRDCWTISVIFLSIVTSLSTFYCHSIGPPYTYVHKDQWDISYRENQSFSSCHNLYQELTSLAWSETRVGICARVWPALLVLGYVWRYDTHFSKKFNSLKREIIWNRDFHFRIRF